MKLTTTSILVTLAGAAPGHAAQHLNDENVRDAIEREVLYDAAVPSDRIDVAVSAGVATLTGTVGNLLAMERAARIAETVKGVRSVVNQIEVEAQESRPDVEIQKAVKSALATDPAADSYEVDVEVHDGHVVLKGSVDSWQEKDLSATVAKGVQGVVDLTNDLHVSFDAERPDVEIEQEIEQALRWNVLVDHGLVDVAVEAGEVRLSGTVGSAAEKRQVRADSYVAGVRSVDDSALRVARWARDGDLRKDKYVFEHADEIRAAVEAAMAVDPRVRSFDVDTSVSMGVVTLRGVVDNLKAKRAAEQDARNTVGVTSVRNHLKVRPVEERENDAIESDVRDAFLRDPFVERYEIEVVVHDGTVYLNGAVDSFFEKGQADDLTSRVAGVTDVVNELDVEDRPYAYDPYVDDWSMYGYPWYGYAPYGTMEDDLVIEREIEDELFWSPFVDADEVTVTVRDGVATLEGTVDSAMEKGAARDNAFDGGARRVRNLIEISSMEGEETSAQ